MATLATDWICIGQSGPTVDGRTIEASWLIDAAETYDLGVYTALLWPDHLKYYNFGKVIELKTETAADGRVSLFARVQPNAWYLWENSCSQKLFFSMEIEPDFAQTGKAYLVGLAVTDLPASLGTGEMHFSQRKNSPASQFILGTECDIKQFSVDAKQETSLFERFRDFLGAKNNYEDEMDEDFKKELISKLDALQESIDKLQGTVDELQAAVNGEEFSDSKQQSNSGSDATTEDHSLVLDEVVKLGAKLAEIGQRLERAQNFTTVPAVSAPVDGATPMI